MHIGNVARMGKVTSVGFYSRTLQRSDQDADGRVIRKRTVKEYDERVGSGCYRLIMDSNGRLFFGTFMKLQFSQEANDFLVS